MVGRRISTDRRNKPQACHAEQALQIQWGFFQGLAEPLVLPGLFSDGHGGFIEFSGLILGLDSNAFEYTSAVLPEFLHSPSQLVAGRPLLFFEKLFAARAEFVIDPLPASSFGGWTR